MNKDAIIGTDFQGWPIYKMNIKDIIIALGAKLNSTTNKWEIDNNEILEIYPRRFQDDGMGYGVNEQWITEVSLMPTQCNIFTES